MNGNGAGNGAPSPSPGPHDERKGNMEQLLLLVMLVTIVWMVADARDKGRSWGSTLGWALGAVLLWVVFFPSYLIARKHFGDKATDAGATVSKTLDV